MVVLAIVTSRTGLVITTASATAVPTPAAALVLPPRPRCVDTANWTNSQNAAGCLVYAQKRWCVGGRLSLPMWGGKFFQYPETNCCACGGGHVPPTTQPPTVDRSADKGALVCTNTPKWDNHHGFGCGDYVLHIWCAGGQLSGTYQMLGGTLFHDPVLNCCACGKRPERRRTARPSSAPKPRLRANGCADTPGWQNHHGFGCSDYGKYGWCLRGQLTSVYARRSNEHAHRLLTHKVFSF